MTKNLMQYDLMVQQALRGVVRTALKRAADTGLPGEHHFYIAFRTDHPDVAISPRLKSRYPQEMTIVLQHQFWGLQVFDDHFEVGLSFNQIPEELHIPFAAIKGFYDPSVQFGMEFEVAIPDGPPEAIPDKSSAPEPDKSSAVVSLDSFRKKS